MPKGPWQTFHEAQEVPTAWAMSHCKTPFKLNRGNKRAADSKNGVIMAGGYISVCYGYSLRGNEGFLINGDRLVSHIKLGKHERPTPHVCVTLLGKFKGESGDKMQVFPLANVTKSGVKIRWWLEQVANILRVEDLKDCPAFCDEKGFLLSVEDIEEVMQPPLKELQGSEAWKPFYQKESLWNKNTSVTDHSEEVQHPQPTTRAYRNLRLRWYIGGVASKRVKESSQDLT